MLNSLLARNVAWSKQIREDQPEYFPRLAKQQTPAFLWIGCSDSRVPANQVAGMDPGEIFVHRNVANVVHSSDMNMLAALEFSVNVLKVKQIIVCGHYGCGGVKASTEDAPHGLADHWVEPIRRLYKKHAAELQAMESEDARLDRLSELNVLDGVARVCETPVLRFAWKAGVELSVHGLIYGLKDGLLRNLDCTVTGATAR